MADVEAYRIKDLVESGIVGRTTIWREAKAGRLRLHSPAGRLKVILKRDFDEWLAARPVALPTA